MRHIKSAALLLLACTVVLTGCTAVTPTPQTPGGEGETVRKVVVATDATWPPFEFVDEATKEIIGFDIDLMKAIAKAAGFEVEFQNVPFDPLLAGMATGQYDAAISAITITEDRKENMLFSEPYFNAGQLIVVQATNDAIQSPADLAGKLVGAQIATTGARAVEELGANLKTYDDVGSAYLDLANGQVEAVVADSPLAIGYVIKYEGTLKSVGEPFTTEEYGIAVKKGDEALLTAINQGLQAVKAQGLIEELAQQWMSWFASGEGE